VLVHLSWDPLELEELEELELAEPEQWVQAVQPAPL